MYYRYWTCCDSTQISPRSKECRSAHDECDLAEYCDGTSTECPEDVFAMNGLQCDGGQGYCHNGQCPQRPNQCVKMYGPGVCVCVCVCVLCLFTRLCFVEAVVIKDVTVCCRQALQRPVSTAMSRTPEEPTSPSANVPPTTSGSPARARESLPAVLQSAVVRSHQRENLRRNKSFSLVLLQRHLLREAVLPQREREPELRPHGPVQWLQGVVLWRLHQRLRPGGHRHQMWRWKGRARSVNGFSCGTKWFCGFSPFFYKLFKENLLFLCLREVFFSL